MASTCDIVQTSSPPPTQPAFNFPFNLSGIQLTRQPGSSDSTLLNLSDSMLFECGEHLSHARIDTLDDFWKLKTENSLPFFGSDWKGMQNYKGF